MRDILKILSVGWLHFFIVVSNVNVSSSTNEDISFYLFNNLEVGANDAATPNHYNGSDVGQRLILTNYIEKGKLNQARKKAAVPKKHLLKNIDSYAGYLTVNKKYNGNLFFWYFPVMNRNVEETPLLIWLQGGPGSSSLFGLFSEIGPYYVGPDKKLQEMHYSWGKNHSLLFIDNPVGTGYSFVDEGGYATNQTTIGENLYSGLQQLLTLFPELRKAPMVISGESYAGKHVPSLAVQIHRNKNKDAPINLQGLAIGNGFIDPKSLLVYSYFAKEVGLIDDNTADKIRLIEESAIQHIDEGNFTLAKMEFEQVLQGIIQNGSINIYNYLTVAEPEYYVNFTTSRNVRKSIHVGNTTFQALSLTVYRNLIKVYMTSEKALIEELIPNYRVLCFNGHLDIVVAYHPSVNTYSQLKYPGSEQYKTAIRSKWYHGDRLAGFVKTVGNFSEVMVRGAGHLVAKDQPAAALAMITAFARGISLTENTGNLSPP